MNNKVDIQEVETLSKDVQEASTDIQSTLTEVEKQIEQIIQMDSFSGEAATSAKEYFGEMHLTLLESFKGLFEDLEGNLQQHVKAFESKVDGSDSAVIRSTYLQDAKEEINELFEDLQKQDEIIHDTIAEVSDITSATPPSFSDVYTWKNKAIKQLEELEEDFDSFTGEGDVTNVEEIMEQIKTVMGQAQASKGSARFTEFQGISKESSLAKLQAYNEAKSESETVEQVNLDQPSQQILHQINREYDAGNMDQSTYEAMRSGILQKESTVVEDVKNGKLAASLPTTLHENVHQWANNAFDFLDTTQENQDIDQNMTSQPAMQNKKEDQQLKAFLQEGNFEDDEYNLHNYEPPKDDPIDFLDKRELMEGPSGLAGRPDGLAGPAAFMFDKLKKPFNLFGSAENKEMILDKLPDSLTGPAATTFNISQGIDDGVENFIDDTLVGTATMIGHPIETGTSLWNAVSKPLNTYEIMKDAISTSFERDVTNGDAESRSRWFSYATATIGTSLVGTSGPNATSKLSSTAANTTTKSVTNNANRLNFNNPFNLEPALSTGPVDIPYNVYNGETIKNQTFQFAKKFEDGKVGPYNKKSLEHIFLGEINKKKKAVGYHHESMMGGKIIPGTKTKPDKNGVYMAKVEINGTKKKPSSSFFPEHWNRADVLKAVGEAYENKKLIRNKGGPNTLFKGSTSQGMEIQMYINNKNGNIQTAYPLYKEV